MKNALLIVSVLFVAIMSTACINNFAVQELNNKAAEYIAKGDYNSAIGRLEASIDIDPTIFETYYNLGIACTNAEEYEKAISALEKAVSLKPDNIDTYYSLAVAKYNYAEEILEGDDDSDDSDKQKAEIDLEDIKKVVDLYNSAIDSLKTYLNLGEKTLPKETIDDTLAQIQSMDSKSKEISSNNKG